ncbi:hypothetical protein A4G99_10660 [Haladaptatus sp. R4]|nr:hypothetical protein A4G99_10660 [Haladaptatus sp. R4]
MVDADENWGAVADGGFVAEVDVLDETVPVLVGDIYREHLAAVAVSAVEQTAESDVPNLPSAPLRSNADVGFVGADVEQFVFERVAVAEDVLFRFARADGDSVVVLGGGNASRAEACGGRRGARAGEFEIIPSVEEAVPCRVGIVGPESVPGPVRWLVLVRHS